MSTDNLIIDGRAYSWKRLRALRQQQLEARRNAEGVQPALFELREDCRPPSERSAASRYHEPSLLDWPHAASRDP